MLPAPSALLAFAFVSSMPGMSGVWAVAGALLLVILGLLPASAALEAIGKGSDMQKKLA